VVEASMNTMSIPVFEPSPGIFSLRRPGARVTYRAARRTAGRGPAVLLVQGVGVSGQGWRPQIEGLQDRFTLVAPDNRGVDGSDVAAGTVTIEHFASDALAAMDAEGIEQFHLVGHSMGGLIAQEIALLAPQRVKSLVFMNTFATGKQGARLTPGTLWAGLRTRLGTRRMRRNAFIDLVMPPAVIDQLGHDRLAGELEPLFGRDLAESPAIIMKQLRAMAHYDASADLVELGAYRTLVLAGGQDRIALPAHGRALAAAIPGARYVEIPEAAHGLPIQCANTVNRMLREHFVAAEGR
jgi:pimeloyl-ACP methyl ester carboxylesterase